MSETCAVCGERESMDEISVTHDWMHYLHDERGLEYPAINYHIPVCSDCYTRADRLRSGGYSAATPSESEDLRDLLDGLHLDHLVDRM
ncbi:hypothetical protein GCM10009037_06970 [Halarchaeum grantii]|uniref:Uncharacterized protein n=1 Tax=Halarchaeum grantii TaxID=1193105 RepID=A0A830EZX8_9EURY|nr:hypothetical protein [Halarchaeum grantii]GGL25946.1 hypothetical protein GCM10009037_06970 [Halarchaeum grantii]